MAECIDREAMLHDIEQSVVYTAREKITSAEMRGAHKIIERIKCAPAVEPIYIHEPIKSEFKRMAVQMDYVPVVHGQWDDIPNEYMSVVSKTGAYHGNATTCSVCHDVNPNAFKTNYCPNCGAKMDGGTNEPV